MLRDRARHPSWVLDVVDNGQQFEAAMFWRTTASKVRRQKLTYLSSEKLASLGNLAKSLDNAEVPGDFVEFGVALGGSGICLTKATKRNRRYFGFDVFGMIPP